MKALEQMWQRVEVARQDSDSELFSALLLAGEMALKLTTVGLLTGNYSRLAWLNRHLQDDVQAKYLTEEGLRLDGDNEHLKRLAEKLSLF